MSRVAFIEGRPSTHPNRVRLLREIAPDFVPVDFVLPWAHLPDPPQLRRLLSLSICAFKFPKRNEYHLLLGDGPQFLPVVMKVFGLLNRRQRIVPYLANETPYFLATKWYGPRKTAVLKSMFNMWDGYLCIGEMVEELTKRVTDPRKHANIFTTINCIRKEKYQELRGVRPKLDSMEILFVGNGPSGFRVWYKGLDLMLEAFRLASREHPLLRFTVVGDWDGKTVALLLAKAGLERSDRVKFVGPASGLAECIERSGLYLHCGRGDAWPNSVMEAMCGGLPALVSEWTGTRGVVREVSASLVAPLDPVTIAERICGFVDLPRWEKQILSDRCREVSALYTEERAVSQFVRTFRKMLLSFDLPDLPKEVVLRYDPD